MAKFAEDTASVKREAGRTKKKKKETTQRKTTQSPSVSNTAQDINNRFTQKYGGGSSYRPYSEIRESQTETRSNNQSRTSTSNQTTSVSRNPRMQDTAFSTDRTTPATAREMRQQRQVQSSASQNNQERPRYSTAEEMRQARQTQTVNDRLTEKYGTGVVRGGKHTYMDDVAKTMESTIRQTAAEEKRFVNTAFKGLTDKNAYMYASQDQINKANKKYEQQDEALRKKIKQETAEMEKLKEGHSYLGKQGLSAVNSTVGMATDAAWGPASLLHMFMRTQAGSQGNVKDKVEPLKQKLAASGNYTQAEIEEMFNDVDKWDYANSIFDAGIEVLSERMFTGIGLGKKVGGVGFLDKSMDKLWARMGSKTTTGLLGKIAKGTAEEVAEEEVGNPLQTLASNLIYGNRLQAINEDATRRSLQAQSDALKSRIQNPQDAQTIATQLNSQSFFDDSKKVYLESGASDKDAEKLAGLTRDYLEASVTGDIDRAEEIQNKMVKLLADEESSGYKEKWTLQDAIDVAVSTSMMTTATGGPVAMINSRIGTAYKDTNGMDAVNNLAKITKNLDPERSARAQAVMDRIEAGEDISGTQVYDLIQWASNAATEVYRREDVKERMANDVMRNENLQVAPSVRNEDGSVTLGEETEKRYEERYDTTLKRVKNLQKIGKLKDVSQDDVEVAADVSTAYLMGTITANQINELSIDNAAVRSIFQTITGIDLNQFNVYDKNGDLKTAESNIEMQKALFARAADNYIQSARIEQEAWNDGARGEVATAVASRIGSNGDVAVHDALNAVDPRDKSTFMLMGSAVENVYDYSRYSEDSWDAVKGKLKKMYPSLPSEALRGVYESAKQDKAIAENPYYNAIVSSGNALNDINMSEAEQAEYGKFTNEAQRILKDSEQIVLQSLAKQFTINIKLLPSKEFRIKSQDNEEGKNKYSNGFYDPKTGTMYLNGGNDMERNLVAVALHEITHHIAVFAPDEYLALSNRVMDRWYKNDAEAFKAAIQRKQESYKRAVKQELSEEQALEEVIADAVGEMSADQEFVEQICRDEPSLAHRILNAIRDVLRRLRQILSSNRVSEEYEDAFFSQLDMWSEAERLWLNAARAAQKNRADMAIDDLQNRIYAEGSYSISDEFVVRDGNARWTDERIDRLIRENGASNEDYSQAYATLMNPRDYLRLTLNDEMLGRWNEGANDPAHPEVYSLNEAELSEERQTPFLQIWSSDGTRIQGHEGRHRMRALMEAGIDSVPVVIRDLDTKYSKTKESSMFLKSQDFGDGPVNNNAHSIVFDLVPIKESNRDELIRKFGGKAQVRFSISDEDYMAAVNSGNMEEAQRMVDQAANEAGYVEAVYHGTGEYFNVFRLGDEGIHLGNEQQASQVAKQRYEKFSRRSLYKLSELADNIDRFDDDTINEILSEAERKNLPAYNGDVSDRQQLAQHLRQVGQEHERTRYYEPNISLPTFDRETGEHVMKLYSKIQKPLVLNGDMGYWSTDNIAKMILSKSKGKTKMDGVDISGSTIAVMKRSKSWETLEKIQARKIKGDAAWDALARVMEQEGYDGIKYLNQYEGDKNSYSYIALRQSDIKSADTVTYDDNGNVIPLSERFNQASPDVRYSVSALGDAVGLTFSKEGSASVLTDANGNRVDKVTREMVIESPLGYMLSESVRKNILPESVISPEKSDYDEVDFVVDTMNMILNVQDIDMLYAISGTLGYDPTNLINEDTPAELIKEKGSRFVHIRSNSEAQYGTTVDFTTICVKTQAVIDAMSAVMKTRKAGLTKDEVINIVYKEVYNAGEQVPCPVCYVFSRWVGLGGIFDTMKDLQEKFPETMDTEEIRKEFSEVVKQVDQLIAASERADKKLKGTKAREVYYKQVQDRLNELDQIEFYSGIEALKDKYQFTDELKAEKARLTRELELLDAWSWLMNTRLKDTYKPVPLDILYDINAGKTFAEEYPDSWKFRTTRGAGMGKAAIPYTPAILGNTIMGINTGGKVDVSKRSSGVFTDLKKNPFLNPNTEKNKKSIKTRIANAVKKVKAQNVMNGQRLQSTSDFRFEYALDYLLNFLEFSALGAKAQLYTKVPEAVPFLASTGTECNCSIMAKGTGLVKNRKVGDHYIGIDYEFVRDKDGNITAINEVERETDQEYSLVFSDITGMDIRDALLMSKTHDNVQPILVAIGRQHLITAMANPNLTMIIPYHSSGSTVERYRAMMEIVGEGVEDREDFAAYESEHEVAEPTAEQLLARDIRKKILTGKYFVKNSFKKPSAEEAAAMQNNEHLRQLFIRFYGKDELGNDAKPNPRYVENFDENGNDADCYHVVLNGEQASVIMPHEYWDKGSTINEADAQGKEYAAYCESLGYHPVFSGWDSKGYYHEDMDFTQYPGYWKTLIDRCMYNNDGTYHKQQAVRVKDAQLDMINASEARSKVHKPLQVNDPAKTEAIAANITEQVDEKRAAEAIQERQDKLDAEIQKRRGWLEQEGIYMESDAEVLSGPPEIRLSISPEMDEEYMDALESDSWEGRKKAWELIATASKRAGFTKKVYHGTPSDEEFYKFATPSNNISRYRGGSGFIYVTTDIEYADVYAHQEDEDGFPADGNVMSGYINPDNMLDIGVVDDAAFKPTPRTLKDGNTVYSRNWPDYYDETSINERASDQLKALANVIRKTPYELMHMFDESIYNEVGDGTGNLYDFVNRPAFADYVKEEGYDGIKLTEYGSESYGLLESNQFKSAELITYAEDGSVIPLSERFDPNNNDIRYSLPTQDSDGNILSDGQMEYFKNSQARDEQGRLVPMYHVTPAGGFTIFESVFSFDETSFSFSNDLDFALNYSSEDGNPEDWQTAAETRLGEEETEGDRLGHYKVYLDMQNPLVVTDEMFDEMSIYEWPAYAKREGYDGVIHRDFDGNGADIYQVFSSSQIKDTRNTEPTNNPDIRYSFVPEDDLIDYISENAESMDEMFYTDPELEEGRARLGRAKADFIFSKSSKWNARWLTEGLVLDEKKTKKAVREAVMSVMSKAEGEAKYKTELVDEAMKTCKKAFYLMKIGKFSEAGEAIYDLSKNMVENNNFFDDTYEERFNEYVELRNYIRARKFYVPDLGAQEFAEHRRQDMGKIWLCSAKKGTSIDEEWPDLSKNWPEYFSPDIEKPSDMLFALEQALVTAEPMAKAYCSEEAADYIDTLASQLYDIVYEGEEYQSLADMYKASAERKTAAMKQRFTEAMRTMQESTRDLKAQHREEIRQLKAKHKQDLKAAKKKSDFEIAELKQNRDYNIQRLKSEKRRAVAAEKQKNQQRNAERRARAIHKKHFDSINKNYKKLVDRLLTNTKDKNIPEIFKKDLATALAAFDLQTIKSKESETHTGPADKYGNQYVRVEPSNKTIQMMLLRSQLEKIGKDTEDFQIRGPVQDIIERLSDNIEGKTIDDLNEQEIQDVDDLLKALVHEFNEYKRVTIEGKKEACRTIASAQIDHALKHAETFGQGKDYFGMLGAADKILNMDEVTPAYLFRRIDPERNGIGKMYREIRKSFDKYVRNQQQLNEWMNEILEPYHNKGRAWKQYGSDQIDEWRDARSIVNFNLANGTVSLTPAQMMSLYCLKKRPQALKHMRGAGIVVAPVSFQAKAYSDVKKRLNKTTPIVLSDTDIELIVSEMTKEQIDVADKLQQLMVNQMAEWGNEAAMDVMGIRLFTEKEYFPIKSDRAALKQELNDQQFVQAIRNFGFAKAVEPKASNAIVIDDIFDVVAEHCNNMNLYNAYSKSMDDFMKVYNFHEVTGEGETYRDISVGQALAQAYSKKAPAYIMAFLRDLNGNVSGNGTGIEDMMNKALGNAKKAAVFANGRVALQQPTAIARAFAEIDPKYLKGIAKKPSRGSIKATMDEMFEHCPIALWKSWGYYDINMGKSIEDMMMNDGNWLEDRMTDLYGKLDNITWTAIWQMCKAEVEDKHSDVEKGSEEYWELVNDRMTDVVDFTQVVDSPMHRSHAMRNKAFYAKLATSFMAEPTLTYNMFRDGFIRTIESAKMGDKAAAARIGAKTIAVYVFASALTSAFAAVWDAVRGKSPEGDGDDDDFLDLWLANFLANMQDDIKIWNKVYYVKDVASLLDGWNTSNLALQGWKSISDGWAQLTGNRYVKSNKTWYENLFGGLGSVTGLPLGTLIKDVKAIYHLTGVHVPIFDAFGEYLETRPDVFGGGDSSSGSSSKSSTKKSSGTTVTNEGKVTKDNKALVVIGKDEMPIDIRDGSLVDNFLNHFGINLTASEIAQAKATEEAKEREAATEKIKEKYSDLSSGEEKDKKVWNAVTTYIKDANDGKSYSDIVQEGNYNDIEKMRHMYVMAGGDEAYFDERIFDASKKALKKSIIYDPTTEQIDAQTRIKEYLTSHGMTDNEMSQIAYKSNTAKELKVAFRINDKSAMLEELKPLVDAGLTYADLEKLWKYRNRVDLKAYKESDGKYADRLKSTGTYIWPISGRVYSEDQITSHYGYRNTGISGASNFHQAIDIGAPSGTPVVAVDGGTVIFADWNGAGGKTVKIQHDDGTITYYQHLSWWDANVGDVVAQGQTIGNVGSTGVSSGPHLDIRFEVNGDLIDPLTYLAS